MAFGNSGSSWNFSGFGNNQQQQKQEEPEFKLSEQMLFEDVTDKNIRDTIIDVYKEIENNKKLIREGKESNSERQKTLDQIHDKVADDIFGSLSSIARQIDSGTKLLKEYENDLKISKTDHSISNSEPNESHPSVFLLKYVDDLEKTAESLSQSISAYSSHLQSQTNSIASDDQIENQTLFHFLKEQSEAIYRCSTKVSRLNEKRNRVQQILNQKLKINTFIFNIEEEATENSTVQSIKSKYQQFQEQKKQKEKKNSDQSDILGNSTVISKTATNSFGFNFGNTSFGSGFGKK